MLGVLTKLSTYIDFNFMYLYNIDNEITHCIHIFLLHERKKYFRCNIFRKLASKEADFKQNYYNNGLKYKIYNNGLKYKICIAKLFQQFMGFNGFDHLYR